MEIPYPIDAKIYIPRGGYVAGYGSSSAFGDLTENLDVPLNAWCLIESTLVEYAYFDLHNDFTTGDFFVQFLSSKSLGVYEDAPVRDWRDFIQSPSHGVWLTQVYFPKGMRPRRINMLVRGTGKATKQQIRGRDVGTVFSQSHLSKAKHAGRRIQVSNLFKSQAFGRNRR